MIHPIGHSIFTKASQHWFAVFLLLALLACHAYGQSDTEGSTPLGLAPGAPAGSYALSGFDNVNLFNGNLSFHLPLLGVGGRGGARYQMTLPIDQTWTIFREKNEITGVVSYNPEPNWWDGIKPGYGPGVLQSRHGGYGSIRCGVSPSFYYLYTKTLTRLTFTAADGTEYELRDQQTGGQPQMRSSCSTTAYNRGRIFVTADGTSATFISDTDITDKATSVGQEGLVFGESGYLLMADGTRYRIDGGTVTWIRDRNGNKTSFAYDAYKRVTTITDSLDRQVIVAYSQAEGGQYGTCDRITFNGFGGAPRYVRVCKTSLGSALRNTQPSDITTPQTYGTLFPELNGNSPTVYNPTVASSVWLPNDQHYQLYYNTYGELARVTLPTGGALEYDYTGGFAGGNASGVFGIGQQRHVHRRVIERRVYTDGVNLESKMTYSRPESMSGTFTYLGSVGYVITDQLNGVGSLLARQYHYFYGTVHGSFYTTGIQYPFWQDGREYKTEFFDSNGTTVLHKLEHIFEQRAPVTWWVSADPNTRGPEPPNDPRVAETIQTLVETNQVSKQTFSYNPDVAYNLQSNVYDYDYGVGTAGALLRRTHTEYLMVNSVNGVAYDTLNPSASNPNLNATVHLRGLPIQQSLYDASGAEQARTTFEYDNYSASGSHAPLMDRPAISGLDSTFTALYQTRGNVTSIVRWLLPAGTQLALSAQYDIAGNVVKAIDARGEATETGYASAYQYAFPTSATSPVPDPTGQHGSNSAFVTTTAYDFSTGLVTSTVDANNQVTNYEYDDPLGRPTRVVRAVGTTVSSQASIAYNDAERSMTTTTDLNAFGDNLLKSVTLYDGLGRTLETRTFEPDGSYITSRQEYDALGRVRRVYNPYRTTADETYGWTVSTYDALSRVVRVETFKAGEISTGAVMTAYNGNMATVTDQAGKQRRSVTDAVGRLTSVVEDPNGLNYQTSYSYDGLGNLRTVQQGQQTRSFTYDSLSRLTAAQNPESGTVTYAYDPNGNLAEKTDARGIKTTYMRISSRKDRQTAELVEFSYHGKSTD